MMIKLVLLVLCCMLATGQGVALAARKTAMASGVSQDIAGVLADPMSPVNPYNSGVDPITMPGDARMAVFTYSRDQIWREARSSLLIQLSATQSSGCPIRTAQITSSSSRRSLVSSTRFI
jgi:hypothetical protein